MGEYYSINPENCSMEELEAAILECESKEEYYHTMEQSCKTFINSMYGAIGSNMYNCSNVDIAESITKQGQHLIKFSVKAIDAYFKNHWRNDLEAHKRVGNAMLKLYPDFNYDGFVNDAARLTLVAPTVDGEETLQVYGDTDSAYISIQVLMDMYSIPIPMQTDFVLVLHKEVLEPYLDMAFEKYAKNFNCPENKQKLELEKTARTVIMLAKKNYIMDISWTDSGSHIKPLHKLVYKGFDVVKGATPKFCRECMIDFIKSMLSKFNSGEKPTYQYIVEKIKGYKKAFSMQSPNDVSKIIRISDYNKFIMNDKPSEGYERVYDSKRGDYVVCPIHIRAAAVYNNMLHNKGSRYKSKYGFIHTGDKVRFYYCDGNDIDGNKNVFGFVDGQFPAEFAPKMDMEYQFEKMILDPINRIVSAMGFDELPSSLTFTCELF